MGYPGTPSYKVKIDGADLSDTELHYVISIEYVESLDQLDAMTMRISIPESPDGEALLKKVTAPGATWSIELDYDETGPRSGEGDIVEITHIRNANGPRVVLVRGLDGLHKLKTAPRHKLWEVGHDSIVSDIAGEHGFSASAEGVDGTADFTFQSNIDDALFLKQLAREHNYYLRVEQNELKFGRRQAYAGDVEVDWNANISEIRLTASLDGLVTEVNVYGWDYLQDTLISGSASASDAQKISGSDTGVSLAASAFGPRKLNLDHAIYTNTSTANDRAKAELQSRAERYVQGQLVSTTGLPSASSGGMLTIKNAGPPFDGAFLIRQTCHRIEPGVGYRTIIDFVSDSLPKS